MIDMQLLNPDQPLIPFEKLEGYSLNSNHSEGRHKAIVFRSASDIGLAEAEELRLALQQAIITHDALLVAQTLYLLPTNAANCVASTLDRDRMRWIDRLKMTSSH
jgi:hypothetical protein